MAGPGMWGAGSPEAAGGGYPQGYPQGGGQPGQPTVTPDVIIPGGSSYARRVTYPFIPDFTALTTRVDAIASRFPWWLWLVAGAVGWWWFQRRRGRSSRVTTYE